MSELERRALWFVVVVGILSNYLYTCYRANIISFPGLVTVSLAGVMANQDKDGNILYIPVYKERK